MDNLILVGFSCSGKTTLGRNVARRLRLAFVDSDRCIEEMTGRTIPEIFREETIGKQRQPWKYAQMRLSGLDS